MSHIMGIVNVTTDSFSDGGRYLDTDAALAHAERLRAAGARIIDVGGESTRPGAERIAPELERARVVPVVRALADAGVTISIDTMNASTAVAAVEAGARIVNDVSGGLADPDMLAAVAPTDAEIALGHWRGHSADMYAAADYRDVVAEVCAELEQRVADAGAAGIAAERIILDPGIGFGKRGAQNWDVLRGLERIVRIGPRVLVGTSRKRFLAETLAHAGAGADSDTDTDTETDTGEVDEARRDAATAITSVLAAQAGAWAVRVHDVAATRDALTIAAAWKGEAPWTS